MARPLDWKRWEQLHTDVSSEIRHKLSSRSSWQQKIVSFWVNPFEAKRNFWAVKKCWADNCNFIRMNSWAHVVPRVSDYSLNFKMNGNVGSTYHFASWSLPNCSRHSIHLICARIAFLSFQSHDICDGMRVAAVGSRTGIFPRHRSQPWPPGRHFDGQSSRCRCQFSVSLQ